MVYVVVLIVIVGPCVVVLYGLVVVEIPLLVACETMYVTIVVEVYIEDFVVYVFVVVTSVSDKKFIALSIFGILTIILVALLV